MARRKSKSSGGTETLDFAAVEAQYSEFRAGLLETRKRLVRDLARLDKLLGIEDSGRSSAAPAQGPKSGAKTGGKGTRGNSTAAILKSAMKEGQVYTNDDLLVLLKDNKGKVKSKTGLSVALGSFVKAGWLKRAGRGKYQLS